ncbi:hypothetical protein BBP00_00008156 [Phytophthora kernoviae]|uniref:mitogen-activated protein kinase kinase n=1 Tax=Phytophthora kernoviae TaxID=325452 RepID=A0A3F2RI86_9STRA|nr:hypothetical protein BBP00_00008156 [Phytophthora kernoviae]
MVIRCDLKCNQILVSKDGVGMLTDFGLSFLTTVASGEKTVGAIRWKAPERIHKDNPVAPSVQSDVYSFGICVVEVVTGEVPWGSLPDPVVKFHMTRQKLLQRPKAFTNDKQWELVYRLCTFDPTKRIKLSDAINQLHEFAEEERFQERLKEMAMDDEKEEKENEVVGMAMTTAKDHKPVHGTRGSIHALIKMRLIHS